MKRAISLLLALFALGSCAAASAKPQPGKAPEAAESKAPEASAVPRVMQLERPKGGEWFGLYVLGKKAGYAFFDIREGELEGQKVVIEESRVTLKASVAGVETMREVGEQRIYEYKDGGRLLAFREERRGDGGEETLIGRCMPEGISLVRKRPGLPDETRSLPPTGEVVEHSDAPRLVAHTREKISGLTIDLDQTLEDKTMVTELDSEGAMIVAGVAVPVVRTRTTEERSNLAVLTTVSKEDGRILELRFGEVMVGKAEDEQLAKQLDKVDLFNLTRVVLDKPIPKSVRFGPAEVSFAIRGLAKEMRRESYRQKFTQSADGAVVLTITSKAPTASAKLPVKSDDEEVREALRSTLSVESEAPAIVELAKKVVGGEKDAWEAAKRINLFVNGYLTKSYGTSSDRATDVLAAKKGDCTEHALLFTALARAAGIPARRVDGLVYMDAGDGVPALYWHEWAEVWVGEWAAIDPTFNQPVADPTHIAFGTEGQSDTAGLIGQLQIKVLGFKAIDGGGAKAATGGK
ncbi:MAG: transglutaminase-like domain-containing protein [Myxococcales bacterium]|jgi:hypothetical protein